MQFGSALLERPLVDVSTLERVAVTVRAVSVGAISSVVGAATADSVF